MLRRCYVPFLLLIVTILVYWRLVLTHQYTWLNSPDLANQVLPWFQFQAYEWHHRFTFPMWDPTSWGGQSLFGQGQPGSAYPLNWLLFNLPLHNWKITETALNWYFVTIRYGAALTSYALCRDLGRTRTASIFGACIYAFGGYVAQTKWPQMVNGAVWTPLAFMFLFRCERGERVWTNALLSGCCLGMGWLAGHHQMNLLVSISVVGLWLWLILIGRSPRLKTALLAATCLLAAVGTSAFQTVPEAEYARLALRWAGTLNDPIGFSQTVPYTIHERFSVQPAELLGTFIPNLGGQSGLFIGIIALTLCILGIASFWNMHQVRWLTTIALASLLFSLGPLSLLHGVLYSLVPLLDKARSPESSLILFSLGAAVLAAFGLDAIASPENAGRTRHAQRALLIVGGLLSCTCFLFAAVKMEVRTDARLPLVAISALLGWALLTALKTSGLSVRVISLGILTISLFELSTYANYEFPNRTQLDQNSFIRKLSAHDDIAAFLAAQPGVWRIEYDDAAVPYNFGDFHHLETFNSLTASVAANIWGMEIFSEKGKNLFGLRYYVGTNPNRGDMTLAFTGASGVKVFENPHAYPRAWAVHELQSLPADADLGGVFRRPDFDPHATAFVVGPIALPPMQKCPSLPESVETIRHAANEVQLRATLSCSGIVLVSDPWFPGWQATVDGASSDILQMDGGVRGIPVTAGTHTIQMKYRPRSVVIGAFLTFSTLLLTALVWWSERKWRAAGLGKVASVP